MKLGVLVRYKEFLPVTPGTPLFSLGEGDTPLVRADKLESEIGCGELYFKLEGCNPTGSFKDRGMVVAIAKANLGIIVELFYSANRGRLMTPVELTSLTGWKG